MKKKAFKGVKTVYIASPYTSRRMFPFNKLEQYLRYREVTKFIGRLHDLYTHAFIGPITQSHKTAPFTRTKAGGFDHWRDIDLTFISKSDEVWVVQLPGWDQSIGVLEEITFALKHQIPVHYWSKTKNGYKRHAE